MSIPVLNPEGPPLTILFATETGMAAMLAEWAASLGIAHGAAVRIRDMATYNTTRLASECNILAIVSTHGEGDPPSTTLDFFAFLDETNARLSGVGYAVLALGDSGYDDFCAAGRRLDSRLEALGAVRLAPRFEMDVGETKAAKDWLATMVQRFAGKGNDEAPSAAGQAAAASDFDDAR